MSEEATPEYTDEHVELSDQDKADLESLNTDPPTERPILYVWRELFSHIPANREEHPAADFCTKMVGKHLGIGFADMVDFRDLYYERMSELAHIVDIEIDSDAECLGYTLWTEDVANNSDHYRNIILAWNLSFLDWEMEWDCRKPTAALEVAVMSELYDIFFGSMGLTAQLDVIKFEFTDDDKALLLQALEEHKEFERQGK